MADALYILLDVPLRIEKTPCLQPLGSQCNAQMWILYISSAIACTVSWEGGWPSSSSLPSF